MADGFPVRRETATLADASRRQGMLDARCHCGGRARIDPAVWLRQGLGELPLASFERRLRCRCGAREARLAPENEACEAADAGWTIYVFR